MKIRRPWGMVWHQFLEQHLTTSARVDGPRYVVVCECGRYWEVDS
jgi:hypothetical protein